MSKIKKILITFFAVFTIILFNTDCSNAKKISNDEKKSALYKGKKMFWTAYFDDSKPIYVVELLEVKFGYYDTLRKINEKGNSLVAVGNQSELYKNSDSQYLYKNKKHGVKLRLKKIDTNSETYLSRKFVYRAMAYRKIIEMKSTDSFPEYEFDWDIESDFSYYNDSIWAEDYVPEFIKEYRKAKNEKK